MSSFGASILLLRPANGLIAILSFLVGIYLAGGQLKLPVVESLALFLIVSAGYGLNDLFDQDSDCISKPSRPLPSGALSRAAAQFLVAACLAIAALLLFVTKLSVAVYLVLLAFALFFYACKLSRDLIISNLAVALLASSVFLPAAFVTQPAKRGTELLVVAISLAFLHHLGREIIKDIQDVAGDSLIGRRTLPLVLGIPTAKRIAIYVFLMLAAATYVFYFLFSLSTAYLVIATVGVDLPLLFLCYRLAADRYQADFGLPVLLTKLTMLPGLVALMLAR